MTLSNVLAFVFRINLKVGRLGGGFGVKLTRASLVGGACSLAAHLLQRPVRMVLSLRVMLEAIGKRWPCYFDYEVRYFTITGVIRELLLEVSASIVTDHDVLVFVSCSQL